MIARYTRPDMGRIWSDQNRFEQWLEVELAASESLADLGVIPMEAAQLLREHAAIDAARSLEIEKTVKHDVIAFTTAVAESMARAGHADASRWFHYGLTSNDVVDTAQALVIDQASTLLIEGVERLREVLERRAREFQHTVQVGRTHGVHAEPITFGLKLAIWYEEAGRNLVRLKMASEDLRIGKISGAVGTFAHIGPEIEEQICRPARTDAGSCSFAGGPAGPACPFRRYARHAHGEPTENRPGSPPSAADRSSRSRGVFLQGPKGQLRHAPQT